jgi:membrane glycosyltransferase
LIEWSIHSLYDSHLTKRCSQLLPAYDRDFCDWNLISRHQARSRQRWLILFSLDVDNTSRQATPEQNRILKQRSWATFALFLLLVLASTGSEFALYMLFMIFRLRGPVPYMVALYVVFAILYSTVLVRLYRCPVCGTSLFLSRSSTKRCKACNTTFDI